MAAPQKDINLLPQESWEKKPIGRIIRWALTIGRYIVVTTELIVIICFVSRFKLDRDISNLHEEIEVEQARVRSQEKFENKYRLIQSRLKTAKELNQIKSNPTKILTSLTSFIPLNVTLEKIEFNQEKLEATGYALSESGIAVLINNLRQSPIFNNIELGNISKGPELKIDFSLTTNINLNQ